MADPVVEAAQRALVQTRGHGNSTVCEVAAAREALKPIRELHDAFADYYRGRDDAFAAGIQHVLRDLRGLIYSSEELDRGSM